MRVWLWRERLPARTVGQRRGLRDRRRQAGGPHGGAGGSSPACALVAAVTLVAIAMLVLWRQQRGGAPGGRRPRACGPRPASCRCSGERDLLTYPTGEPRIRHQEPGAGGYAIGAAAGAARAPTGARRTHRTHLRGCRPQRRGERHRLQSDVGVGRVGWTRPRRAGAPGWWTAHDLRVRHPAGSRRPDRAALRAGRADPGGESQRRRPGLVGAGSA